MRLSAAHIEYFNEVLSEFLINDSFLSMVKFRKHGKISCLEHSVSVAFLSYSICTRLCIKADKKSLIRGALLHDFYLYDWHDRTNGKKWHGFRHPKEAFLNAKNQFNINRIEADIIKKHMFPLVPYPPKYTQTVIVCIADKICSACETLKIYPTFFRFPKNTHKLLSF